MQTQYIKKGVCGTFYYKDKKMTKLHREDGSASEWADGTKCWYLNDRLHREDGPACVWADGSREWYLNGEYHREDGPAIVHADGSKEWYLNGVLHREDGPAIEWADGEKEWYLNGECLSEEEFNARTKPIELTIEEIAIKLGIKADKLKVIA